MLRQRRLGLVHVFALCVVISACAGTDGHDGAPGAQGAPGEPGEPGTPGDPGTPGATALLRVTPEPAGANCPSGGVRIEVGVDEDGDGVLGDAEVDPASTTYVCSDVGTNALVRTSAEPPGENCPFGGTRVETGLDVDGDGTLGDAEVDPAATSFVCALAPGGSSGTSTGIHLEVKGVSTAEDAPVTVRFTVKDDRGYPVDLAGVYSQNTPIQPRFALACFSTDPSGAVSPLAVYTKTVSSSAPAGQPTAYSPLTSAGHGTLVENGSGAGDYSYTFPTASTPNGAMAVAYDPARRGETHVVWIQASRQTDLAYPTNANHFDADNEAHYFVPDGSAAPVAREIASQAGCDACHARFGPETTTSAVFHGGGRIDVGMCNVCHNPGRITNPLADSASFIHRIHAGDLVGPADRFHGLAATYPQDLRRCDACHAGAAQGAQAFSRPSSRACQGCHAYVSFTGSAPALCKTGGTLDRGYDGKPLPCNHAAGPFDDSTCATCHAPTGPVPYAAFHLPVVPPDPNNLWRTGGTNANTNAAFLAAAGVVPPGAAVITYDLKSVDTYVDTTVTPNVKRPQITFKLKRDGTDVVFQPYEAGTTTEMMPGFVGSPSVYFAFAVPQDGVNAPADFNASASGYLRSIWRGTASGTGGGTLTGPDSQGYYTVRLTGVQIPATATMLTGGVGYTYALSSAPPLVQTDVPGFPWTPNVPADGKAQGGLSVPARNVWKVATGYTGRRPIVDTQRCNACHVALGVAPTFHAGERNDAPTCSFCHTPNRTSSGWSASSKYFVHAVHAGRMRSVPYTWHALEAGPGYGDIGYPGALNDCTACHVPNSYDFTSANHLDAVGRESLTTVATGTYNGDPLVNASYYTLSPYVVSDGVTNYGSGFSFNAGTGATTQASDATLVITPITAACAGCHDGSTALAHMRAGGGRFYEPRSLALGGAPAEQCLMCHGPGRVAAIGVVHPR